MREKDEEMSENSIGGVRAVGREKVTNVVVAILRDERNLERWREIVESGEGEIGGRDSEKVSLLPCALF